jgi:hypothetical protein
MKELSAGLISIICVLVTIGITLEGISLTTILSQPFNVLSIIGFVIGIVAITAAFSLWKKGHELQHYWKRKRNIKQKLEYRIRHRKKAKKDSKKKDKTGKKKK